jgi:hypothetical protein
MVVSVDIVSARVTFDSDSRSSANVSAVVNSWSVSQEGESARERERRRRRQTQKDNVGILSLFLSFFQLFCFCLSAHLCHSASVIPTPCLQGAATGGKRERERERERDWKERNLISSSVLPLMFSERDSVKRVRSDITVILQSPHTRVSVCSREGYLGSL